MLKAPGCFLSSDWTLVQIVEHFGQPCTVKSGLLFRKSEQRPSSATLWWLFRKKIYRAGQVFAKTLRVFPVPGLEEFDKFSFVDAHSVTAFLYLTRAPAPMPFSYSLLRRPTPDGRT